MENRWGITGMHDPGDWFAMVAQTGTTAWCVYTTAIGCDPNDRSGQNFGVPGLIEPIARLNNGYAPAGTIPLPHRYEDFAQRCANFVQASKGCTKWIIGNEINMAWEYPEGQPITLDNYVKCFKLCRDAIRRVQPNAEVIPQPPAPYNDLLNYPGNERGDWCQQLADMLNRIGECDGIALHTYTHGHNPSLIGDESKMQPPFADRHYQFRAYRDFMAAIPTKFRHFPVYITESNPDGWNDSNNGWVQAAYAEIDRWNQGAGNQLISCLCLYRWQTEDRSQFHISPKTGVVADFRQALSHRYVLPEKPHSEPLYTAYVVAAAGLNMRSDFNAQSEVITTLPFATEIQVLNEFAGWLYVQAGQNMGWVFGGFVSREKPRQNVESIDLAIERSAAKHGLDPKLARAVIMVESAGNGFANGKLIARFEPRVWLTMKLPEELRETGKLLFAYGNRPDQDRISLGGVWRPFHGNNALEHLAIALASAVDRESAIESASYGLPQMMGFNATMVGYRDAAQMVEAFTRSEEAQVDAFFAYCEKKRNATRSALDALRQRDFVEFARLYNGIGQEEAYAKRIQAMLS